VLACGERGLSCPSDLVTGRDMGGLKIFSEKCSLAAHLGFLLVQSTLVRNNMYACLCYSTIKDERTLFGC